MTLEICHWFPPEIIHEILLKVATVKSLLRCKSVCKEWYTLISGQQFIKSHYTLSRTNPHYAHHRFVFGPPEYFNCLKVCPLSNLVFDKSANNALLLENPLQRTRASQDLSIVGSCKGLVCLFFQDDDDDFNLFIYNPSTRIWNGLPSRRIDTKRAWYSFGYDESTDDYKIVELAKVSLETRPYIIKGQIYSLKTGKWKNLGDFSYECPLDGCGVFSNGALHWVACSISPRKQRIVSLDLANETYGEVLQFESDSLGPMHLSLGVLGEWLCVLCNYWGNRADVWVMKVYGVKDSWTKLASFLSLTNEWIEQSPVPLFISNDGKVLFQRDVELIIYDSNDSSVSYIQGFFFGEACIVVESLVSPFHSLGLADNNDDEN